MTRHDLLLFGGAANTGLHLVRHARARGLSVACMIREGRDANAAASLGATVVRGDAWLAADCRRALREAAPRAVISLLGGKDANGRRVDAAGNINAINAAAEWRHGLPFLLLTSLGCDEQFADMPPAVQQALGEALRAKTLAERCLRASPLAWTIARPGGLSHQDGIGRYRLAASPLPGRAPYLSRSDVALAALDLLADATRQKQAWTILAADPEP